MHQKFNGKNFVKKMLLFGRMGVGGEKPPYAIMRGLLLTYVKYEKGKSLSFLLLSAFLRNFFLHQDRLRGDVPPQLAQPC